MGTTRKPTAAEAIGGLLMIQGAISLFNRLTTEHDGGLLALVDKFVFHTSWWAGMICILIGLGVIIFFEQRAKRRSRSEVDA
ncbi:hypothetical protein [Amycolatopsis anabasis]|uniref:hypothetical protein n=1 Tax=Amycolatopsis anabasis TaxID=1840409 RepID=UPI00131DA194|nr:hypothetical protein [Amycolatopsis anabasis]